jgi:hypothetical protein
MKKAGCFVQQYLKEHTDPDNPFPSTGHAFVRLAKEEPNIFKMFILRPRDDISSLEELPALESFGEQAAQLLAPAEQLEIRQEKEGAQAQEAP